MLSKSQISFVNALHNKKHRKENALFITEGIKSISEFLASDYQVDTIFCTTEYLQKFSKITQKVKLLEVTAAELKKISTLTTPQHALALVRTPERTGIKAESFKGSFTLVLDGIQDPGNLGTIIRTADWFGFSSIVCSNETVDAYNPKVVQASMGSLSRIKVHYTDLSSFFADNSLPVFGAMLDGENIFETNFGDEGFVVLGNEGAGISDEVKTKLSKAITIPRFGKAESLNVAISAAIFCTELRRNSQILLAR